MLLVVELSVALDPAQLVCFGLEGSREERKGREKPNRVPHEVPLLLRMSTTVEMFHGGTVIFWRSKGEADTEQIPASAAAWFTSGASGRAMSWLGSVRGFVARDG